MKKKKQNTSGYLTISDTGFMKLLYKMILKTLAPVKTQHFHSDNSTV